MSKPILCLNTHELAWAAGFFDGEGSFCVRKRQSWRELWVQVPQSGSTLALDRFHSAVGGMGAVKGPWQYRKNMLPMYRFDARGHEQVQAIIALLWRYLSPPKREQAVFAIESCLEYFRTRSHYGKGNPALSLRQVIDVRKRYMEAKINRDRVPKGWVQGEADKLSIPKNTLQHILNGHGYIYGNRS